MHKSKINVMKMVFFIPSSYRVFASYRINIWTRIVGTAASETQGVIGEVVLRKPAVYWC